MNSILAQAMQRHRQGDLAGAEPLYREWLAAHPEEGEALHLLAVILAQTDRLTEALPMWRKAAKLLPQRADVWCNLGEAERRMRLPNLGIDALQQAIRLAPQMPEARFNLANAQKDAGRIEEAIAGYRHVLQLAPNHARAWFNLGNTLRDQGKSPPAHEAFVNAVRLQPRWAEAQQNLGAIELELDQAESALQRFQSLMEIAPDHPDVYELEGQAQHKLGNAAAARSCFRKSSERKPGDILAKLRAETVLPAIAPDEASVEREYERLLPLLEELSSSTQALEVSRLHQSGCEPPMLFAYQREELRRLWDLFGDFYAARIPNIPLALAGTHKPHVGIVVTHGHEGVFVACFGQIARLLANDELDVSIVCPTSTAHVLDHLCGVGTFRFVRIPKELDQAAATIRAANIDLLYYWEVGTDAVNYLLPFFRPARVQVAGWGWPVSSGCPDIDYFLSAKGLEPADGARHYREKLFTLTALPTCYSRPAVPGRLEARETFGLGKNAHLYLCHQNLRKWHPTMDATLESIGQQDSLAQFVMIGDKQRGVTELLLARLRQSAPTAASRMIVIPFLDKSRYLNLLSLADVALDTRPYGGGANTVYDCVATGTPLVTWPAPLHRSRWAAATLDRLGLWELIADSQKSYVDTAIRVASEPDYRRHLTTALQQQSGDLFEDAQPLLEHRRFFLEAIAR